MAEGDVTMHLPSLYEAIQGRLRDAKQSGYNEGWNDALYLVLDILEGVEPIAHRDGPECAP